MTPLSSVNGHKHTFYNNLTADALTSTTSGRLRNTKRNIQVQYSRDVLNYGFTFVIDVGTTTVTENIAHTT